MEMPKPQGGPQRSSETSWFRYITQHGPVRYLLQLLQQLFRWVPFVRPLGAAAGQPRGAPACSPDRPVRHARKRLGTLARVILAFVPSQFLQTLGRLKTQRKSSAPDETLKSHVHPAGKGCKRKQEDLLLEEQQYWVEALLEELPEEDDRDDPTYEPTKSETDSEEYRSQNSTETDLEFEEKNGVLMLKEKPTLQAIPDEDDKRGETRAGCNEGNPPAFQILGNDRERPTPQGEKGCGVVETMDEDDTADRGPPGSEPLAASGDSQEQWVCVSGE
uniref:Uncharacterized protein n=1 Tax=Pogona vitticeps TaxID=103695 RepID=A0ABM5ELZ3_9SAUR